MRMHVQPFSGNKYQAVIVGPDDEVLASEVGVVAESEARAKMTAKLSQQVPGMDPAKIEDELLRAVPRPMPPDDPLEESDESASSEEELAEAREVLRGGDFIDQLLHDFDAIGIAGEEDLALAVYLIGTSRLLRKPLHGIVRGDSASGKSFIVNSIAGLTPPESIKKATHLTPKAIYRMPDLRHKFLVLGERSRSDGPQIEDSTKGLREFRSDGSISLSSVQDGKLVEFRVEGPAATIETTTKEDLFDEDANRCLLLASNESSEQTEKITARQAAAYEGRQPCTRDAVIRRHWAMQRLLAEPVEGVVIPYATSIQQRIPKERVETRRAYSLFMGVIEASALLHRYQRASDSEGRIVATRDDYAFAKRLVGSVVAAAVSHAPSETDQRFFMSLRLQKYAVGDTFTAPELGAKLGRDRRRINECLRTLRKFGVVEQLTEANGPNAARWRMCHDTLPGQVEVLPKPGDIPEGME